MSCGKPCECPTYREHLLSVGVSATAMPTRKGDVAHTTHRETVLGKDMDAYKRIRRDGEQPRGIDGCAHLERHASTRTEIERGLGAR